ncbi:chitin synthase-domain-containing protein [Limtongia smithiae]|uniref:chitin synthase-domain-containing protein n=1 Tax=Limtongia smithiae TaxID=1125753 RepID=UPI0034CFB8E1
MPPVADISQLPASALSSQNITAHLGARFHNGMPVSAISSHTLIAFNSYTSVQSNEIVALASRAYDRLFRLGENQLVVFLGESGSGKSELRSHLCSRLHASANATLSKRISCAHFLFSAFTTTKTGVTPEASKSGLLLEYQYDTDASLIGAKFISYRLDRDRVAKVPTGERNFHIFYYLLSGSSNPEREHLSLDSDARYNYLGHPTQRNIGIDDAEGFAHFRSAMRTLNFPRIEIAEMCQVLAAIMHLGQLEFSANTDESDSDKNHATVESKDILNITAAFLGVVPADLDSALVYKTQSFRRERVTIVLDPAGARAHADDLARTLYTMLVQWLIEAVNDKLSLDESTIANTISVVDFPGFVPQSFGARMTSGPDAINQLLYNTANETLYNYMLFAFYGRISQKFEAEDLEIPSIEYFDNSDTVRLLTKPHFGILPLLDDQTRRGRPILAVMDTMQKRYDKNPAVTVSRSMKTFTVRHYDGEVEYSVERIIDANMDDISGDLMNLLTNTTSKFVSSLFNTKAVMAIKHPRERSTVLQGQLSSKPLRQPSILRKSIVTEELREQPREKQYNATGQFSLALDTMRKSFVESNPYFILCIKPNERKMAGQFDVKCVRQQISALGISDIARRVQVTDVSIFVSFNEILTLANFDDSAMLASSDQHKVAQIIMDHSWSDRDVKIGTTGVLLSENAWRALVDPEDSYLTHLHSPGTLRLRDNPFGESNPQLSTPPLGGANYVYANGAEGARSVDALTLGTGVGAPGTGGPGDMFANFTSPENMIEAGKAAREQEIDTFKPSSSRQRWMTIVKTVTFWLPDRAIARIGRIDRQDQRIAWREKFAINIVIWMACGMVIFFIVALPILICPTQHVYSISELSSYDYDDSPDEALAAIRGEVFDLTKFAPGHYPSIVSKTDVLDYAGADITVLFPVQVSALCLGKNGTVDPSITLDYTGENSTDVNSQYHDFRYFTNDSRPDWYYEQMLMLRANYKKGDVGYTAKYIKTLVNDDSKTIASIHGMVFDLTDYVAGGREVLVPAGEDAPTDVDTDFMDDTVIELFQENAGSDISQLWDELDIDADMKERMYVCLRNLFYAGRVDTRNSSRCLFSRYFLLVVSLLLVSVIGVKFLAALQFSRQRLPESLDKFVICQVPAYTEDEDSLRRAIDSLARMRYDDKRKLLCIICDGMIVGAGNDRPTPRIVLDILGVSPDIDPEPLDFESLGEGMKQHNMGKVYSGLYEVQGHIVPFVVIVKVGLPTEQSRPGNRGKRDSQMILMRFLNRVHFNSPMSPLELELYHQIRNVIGVSPTLYEFILQVDADTEVAPDSATRMVSAFLNNTKIIALCGETALSNARKTVITMIQVYEYYISHNLAKAFESLFGSVTCLPGCFSMYRVRAAVSGKPLFVSNSVVQGYAEIRVDTLHMKNLLHLGEDRYLTTLLLRHHPSYKTKFIREAMCLTVAPDTWKVFLSQRRRWINSTVHNLVELVPMSQLCGFCCFSMRFVVFLDLMSTIVQPVTVGYLVYLFYKIATDSSNIPLTSILILVAVYGLQAIIFILRRKWEMIGWMIVYLLAIPIFSFMVPIYSFWHMDDFSWGSTRVVLGEKGRVLVVSDEGKFDPASIPKKRWEDFQAELWDQYGHQRGSVAYDTKSDIASTIRPVSHYTDSPPTEYRGSITQPSAYTNAGYSSRATSPAPQSHRASVYAPSTAAIAYTIARAPGMEDIELDTLQHSMPSDEVLLDAIREILETADLMVVTKKSVREALERRFGLPLAAKKEYISSATEAVLAGVL